MTKQEKIMLYFLKEEESISSLKMNCLLYLSDWFNALINKKQITNITWEISCGLRLKDIFKEKKTYSYYVREVERTSLYGIKIKELRSVYTSNDYESFFNKEEIKILEYIKEKIKDLDLNGIMGLVYSSYPFNESEIYSTLNLVESAKNFRWKETQKKIKIRNE